MPSVVCLFACLDLPLDECLPWLVAGVGGKFDRQVPPPSPRRVSRQSNISIRFFISSNTISLVSIHLPTTDNIRPIILSS